MASAQIEIMGQIRTMADVISNVTVENIVSLRERLKLSQEQLELLTTVVRNSVDQGFSNASGPLMKSIDRRLV